MHHIFYFIFLAAKLSTYEIKYLMLLVTLMHGLFLSRFNR